MIRKLAIGAFIAGLALLVGLVQAGAYLLGLPSPRDSATGNRLAIFAKRGPYSVGVRSLTVDDSITPLTMWYPTLEQAISIIYSYAINMFDPDSSITLATYQGQAVPGAMADLSDDPYPLVVLSPGFAIGSASYAWLAEHLASYGFVVVSPQHHESLDPGVLWRSTIERPHDVLTVFAYIDEQIRVGGEFEGLIDNQTVAVIGHSYGGYTALAAAGALMNTSAFKTACEIAYKGNDPLVFLCDALLPRMDDMAELAGLGYIPAGLWTDWADPRVDTVVSMAGDAAMFWEAGLSEVTIPVMAIGGTADRDSPYMWGTGLTYEYASSDHKIEIALEGAEHMIFAGGCDTVRRILNLAPAGFCSDPAWDRVKAHSLISHFTNAFLLAELKQDANAAAALAVDSVDFTGVTYKAQGY